LRHLPTPTAAISIFLRITSSNDEVEIVISWEALLKLSLVYKSAHDIFSGKAHKDPTLDAKCTMLLNIVSWPWED
jgi:hypothetical protein